jgi:hypothetical protein
MAITRAWDRAASLPAPVDGRRLPSVASLPGGLPSIDELFEFMRDAETRFSTLRLRIVETTATARGDTAIQSDVVLRHPGHARVTTSSVGAPIGGTYDVWISDGELVRTYQSAHRLGTQRPVRARPRGLEDDDFPGTSKVYVPVTPLPAETLPDTFIHPAGYCQNVLATGALAVTGTALVGGREAILLSADHPRTIERVADRPDFRIDLAIDRSLGIILALHETIGGAPTRDAVVTDLGPDAPLPPAAFEFTFPAGTTMLY